MIVESVKRIGLDVPIFCYHPRMKPVGMCRMCLVDVGMKQKDGSVRVMPKPQTACTLPATEGLAIYTDTEQIRKDRKGILEFLLVNHPLDCPVCDRGGECPLQNLTLIYGPSTTRFVEEKRHLLKAFPLSKYVQLDLERCIQCGRCVRFTEEISGDGQLAFLFRGALMQPQTYELTDFTSRFSGNTIEVCPVGALTSAEYRFRARPWDLETSPAICTECSNGCSTWFDHRVGEMIRINGRTNEAVNEEWTCDKGKFGHNYLNSPKRLTTPLVRDGESLREAGWAEAYERILAVFKGGGGAVAGLSGGRPSNESLFLWKRLFTERFESPNLDHRWHVHLPGAGETVAGRHGIREVNTPIAAFEGMPAIFFFGGDPAAEQPILYLRVRKAWFRNEAKVIVAAPEPTEADNFAYCVLRYRPGSEAALLGGLTRLLLEKAGGVAGADELRQAVARFTPEETEVVTGVASGALRRAAEAMAEGFATAASRTLYNLPNGADVVTALTNLAISAKSADRFNLFATEANEQGALEIGVLPGAGGLDTRGILEGCRDGGVRALWLLQCDPFERFPNRELARQALENVEFLLVQDIIETESFHHASVVLPCCAFSEDDGSYTNMERRVQRVRRVVAPKGHAKPSWKVFSELELRMTGETPPFSAKEVMGMLGSAAPQYQVSAYDHLEGEGVILPAEGGAAEPRLALPDYDAMEGSRELV